MFKSGELPLPKSSQKPNNGKTPLEEHDSIFTIDNHQENE